MLRADGPAHVTREQAQAVLELAGVDARVLKTSALGQGVKSMVSRIEIEDREPLALKVFLLGGHTAREHAAYELLGDHQLPMPKMVCGVAETPDFEFGFTLLTMATGEPLNLHFVEIERERLLEVYRGVGAFQAQLHEVHGAPGDGNAAFVAERAREAIGTFLTHGGSRRLAGKLETFFDGHAEQFDRATGPVLCHGDLHPENIFVLGESTELRFEGAIDLEAAFVGDPVMDLTRTIQTCPFGGEDLTAALLEGYGGKPAGFDRLHGAYFVLYELELWNYYARGGSRRPLRSIARRIKRRLRGIGSQA